MFIQTRLNRCCGKNYDDNQHGRAEKLGFHTEGVMDLAIRCTRLLAASLHQDDDCIKQDFKV